MAVVTKQDCITGLQASRILARYGIPVVGFADDPNHFCSRTNACKQVIATNTSNEQLIDSLTALGKNLDQKAVIIPCSDNSIHIISLHRKELSEFYDIILPEHDIIELFMDKVKFYKYCQLHDFPIPTTFFPRDELDLKEIASNINFPCIIKPPRAIGNWWKFFREKVLKIQNSQELFDVFDQCLKATDTPIVQEWILGNDSNLNSCTFYYNNEHEPVITYTSRKLRQWPIQNGEICLGEEIKNETLVNNTLNLMSSVKFRNVGSLEMKLNDRDGQYYIMEVNVCRLPMRFKIVEAGGVELVYTMYCEAAGINAHLQTVQQYMGAKWISIRNDLLASWSYYKRGELSFKEWIDSVRGVNTFAVLSIRDPLPFVLDIYSLFIIMLKFLMRGVGRIVKSSTINIVTFIRSKTNSD